MCHVTVRRTLTVSSFVFDHPWSGLVYNFGRICMLVCLTITFESLDVEVHIYTSGVSLGVKFTYECYRVKVKVTGAKKVNTAFDNDPIRSPQCENRHNNSASIQRWSLHAAYTFRLRRIEWRTGHLRHVTGSNYA